MERTVSDDRIDITAGTRDYVYIFELKYAPSPDAPLRQIDEKAYARPFATDARRLSKVGVNFSRARRCIDDRKKED